MEFFALMFVPFLIIIATWFIFLWRRLSPAAKLPPGPYPFPIIGNILHLHGKTPHKSLYKLSKTYGPLMSLKLGSKRAVVISSPEIAKELLQKHDLAFSGRYIPAAAEAQNHDKDSVVFLSVGSQWRKLRKVSQEHMFTTSRLRATQELREEKLQKLYDYVDKCCESGELVNLREATFITVLNLMSATLFSAEVCDFESNTSLEFKEIFEALVSALGVHNFADFFPILKPIDPQGIQKKSVFCFGKFLAFFDNIISKRLQSRSSTSARKTDFLEILLDLSESDDEISVGVIKHLLVDFFGGGSETTATSVEWALMELLFNPDILSKAKDELKTVTGDDKKKRIQESDISKLPYLQAVIKETFRLHPPAPLLVPRRSENDVQVCGYTIPKDTQIFVNVWGIRRDPNHWSNPDSFDPERFLDKKMDFKGQDFELIPFGCGRRICLGLPLANEMMRGKFNS